MRRIYIIGIISVFTACIAACSRNADGIAADTSGNKENNVAATEAGAVDDAADSAIGNEETDTAAFDTTPAIGSMETTKSVESTSDAAAEEPVVLNVFFTQAPAGGILNCKENLIILEEFNVVFNFYNTYTGVFDYDHPEYYLEDADDVDIILYTGREQYERCAGEHINWTWDSELYDAYGGNIQKYMSDSVEYVSSLSGGALCGFAETDPLDEYGRIYTIAAHSEHKELALKILNWLVAPDTVLMSLYGPRGVCWDVNDDGYYYLTDTGYKLRMGERVDLGAEYGGITSLWDFTVLSIGVTWGSFDALTIPDSLYDETYDWRSWHLMQEYIE